MSLEMIPRLPIDELSEDDKGKIVEFFLDSIPLDDREDMEAEAEDNAAHSRFSEEVELYSLMVDSGLEEIYDRFLSFGYKEPTIYANGV